MDSFLSSEQPLCLREQSILIGYKALGVTTLPRHVLRPIFKCGALRLRTMGRFLTFNKVPLAAVPHYALDGFDTHFPDATTHVLCTHPNKKQEVEAATVVHFG